ncbi:MAG TPA: hypothetical protein VGM90_28205 [Kofleriaceae bacterium]
MIPTSNTDWVAFLELLTRHGAKYLLIGGNAVAAHGRVRFTEDLDVFIDAELANAERVGDAISEFGFPAAGRQWRELAQPNKIMFFGVKPNRIDVLTSISGVSFAECWKGRVRARFGGHSIPVIGLKELRKNKRASGRTKDLLDLALLQELVTHGANPRRKRSSVKRAKGKR